LDVKHGYGDELGNLLDGDLDFHDFDSLYASHNFHSFPAKFPPQLPRLFIDHLTRPGDIVLDPMMGSGTTLVEARIANRHAIGFDIDPISILLTKVKVTHLNVHQVQVSGNEVIRRAKRNLEHPNLLFSQFTTRWDEQTRVFVDYWFAQETQLELMALVDAIEHIADDSIRDFCWVLLSSLIITKSGGVSLAFDLAHTRPHRAKVVFSHTGEVLLGHDHITSDVPRIKLLTKTLRSPLAEFEKRLQRNLASLPEIGETSVFSDIRFADAQRLPLENNSVDLIVTSPPYISNAIDYMRAHKFSLVWLGYRIGDLSKARKKYIGGESLEGVNLVELPKPVQEIVESISHRDRKKGQTVHRYYSEMYRVLSEMHRVLKRGKSSIVVVGTSIIKGIDAEIGECLAEIGKQCGFEVPKIGIRRLDRDRRMLPASGKLDLSSQIQQRMHEEYVIGFFKP